MNNPSPKHQEPEEIFLPLNSKQYAQFYCIEMKNFVQDLQFYQSHCEKGSRILELGCGAGRISQALSTSGCSVFGIDISFPMLQQASRKGSGSPAYPSYICMDMTEMAFTIQFDHILIPYNTLNLLRKTSAINRCLQQIKRYLQCGGSLLLQLHIPDKQLAALNGGKLFQFQTFPLPEKTRGKLIKETLRSYHPEKQEVCLEERYRVRPENDPDGNKDLSHTMYLAAFSANHWLELLENNGFHKLTLLGNYDSRSFTAGHDSVLLIEAQIS